MANKITTASELVDYLFNNGIDDGNELRLYQTYEGGKELYLGALTKSFVLAKVEELVESTKKQITRAVQVTQCAYCADAADSDDIKAARNGEHKWADGSFAGKCDAAEILDNLEGVLK